MCEAPDWQTCWRYTALWSSPQRALPPIRPELSPLSRPPLVLLPRPIRSYELASQGQDNISVDLDNQEERQNRIRSNAANFKCTVLAFSAASNTGIQSQASSLKSERTRSKFSSAWCFTGAFTVVISVVKFRRYKPISVGKWLSIEPVNSGFADRVQACSEYKSTGEASGCHFTQRILFFGHTP